MSIILGVTGGIGSGKSTVCKILSKKYNCVVINADNIAKSVMSDKNIINKLFESFGPDILSYENIIDSKKLSSIVFNNKHKLSVLNSIVHPAVMDEIRSKILEINSQVIILDVPIPIKEFISLCDYIICVVADYEIRIRRVMERSNLTKKEVISIINSQLSNEEYTKIADYVVSNNSTVEGLVENLNKIQFIF